MLGKINLINIKYRFDMRLIKSDGSFEDFNLSKVKKGVQEAYDEAGEKKNSAEISEILDEVSRSVYDGMSTWEIRRIIEESLVKKNFKAGRRYILHWAQKEAVNQFVIDKERFISKYKKSVNNADATVDDNSNVNGKNISLINAEIHKSDNMLVSRGMITRKLRELYPTFNSRNYVKDLDSHIIYKHDESSFAGAIAPYCCSISMYPFLINGIENIGGLSAAPKNIDSFCGMYCNLLFAVASQFAGAVATPEVLVFFDYFARKEWGDDYYKRPDEEISCGLVNRKKTIKSQIHQYFQQMIYTANQPAASRNGQSCFLNFSYFDKPFFDAMFENFYFPDGTRPLWDSLNWLQKDFMMWFNEERLRCLLTFPVESFALIYKDGKFVDEENAKFVADELERGHSFFIYISDTADSLSSCCFGKKTRIMYSEVGSETFEKCEEIGEAYEKHKDDVVEVLSYNPYTNAREWAKATFVKAESDNLYKITFDNRAEWTDVVATHDHIFPISKDGEYIDVEVKNLKVGDKILADKAQWNISDEDCCEIFEAEIKTIEKITEKQDVFCLKMENEESPYFVLSNGLITHNCRLKNKIQTREFSFTNGNIGVETGSKSVITLNLNRITQDFCKKEFGERPSFTDFTDENLSNYRKHLVKILERVYKYHNAYNELLWDMYNSDLLPVYKAGFIDLNKQYLTIGLNGLNQAAEYLGLECHKNDDYSKFCRFIFGTVKEENEKHKTKKATFNTEQVPAESLAVKNYNWDKADGYWVPDDTNLYASYIFKPNDDDSVLDKLYMMGRNFATDQLDGGAAAHINLSEHLSSKQYQMLLEYAANVGCSYWTVNVPNAQCECRFITKHPISKCPKCGSEKITYYDRVIGYLTKVPNWSEARRIEQKIRKYLTKDKVGF